MVLDERVVRVPVPAEWLGSTIALRTYAGSRDATGTTLSVELGLGPVLALPPVHLAAVRDGSGDVVLSWIRRSRADTDAWTLADAPQDLVPERYRVTIRDGDTVVRTIDAGGPGATYTAADQVSDFGAPPASFGFAVAQISPAFGPGHVAEGRFDA